MTSFEVEKLGGRTSFDMKRKRTFVVVERRHSAPPSSVWRFQTDQTYNIADIAHA